MLTKDKRLALLERAFGLRHKIKVHDSMTAPDNHEEQARAQVARWELEDELRAIEGLLEDDRREVIKGKQKELLETLKTKKTLKNPKKN